ncbi:MAG TPA: hypothetical protein PLM35_05210 [Cyclobacteriaceae bacterium]|nr:hypothetical protein [Cyclobacteriaceae bacterium]
MHPLYRYERSPLLYAPDKLVTHPLLLGLLAGFLIVALLITPYAHVELDTELLSFREIKLPLPPSKFSL